MATKTVFITTTTPGSFTVPVDFGTLISVEAIGGGGKGGGPSTNTGGQGIIVFTYNTIPLTLTGVTISGGITLSP